jgi:hypothetical protein
MVTLAQIAGGEPAVPLAFIGEDAELVRDLQLRLGAVGLLDPPVDGSFGPVSHWALREFRTRIGHTDGAAIDARLADALLDERERFPLVPGTDLPGRLTAALRGASHWLCRHPDAVNIVYVEGMDPDGTPNDNRPNHFNDLRIVLGVAQDGTPEIRARWDGTTEPGHHWTVNPMSPLGAARIAFGQYKAWSVGTHLFGKPGAHEALTQTAPVVVHRDLNQDFRRDGDRTERGMFGINQHWGYDFPPDDLRTASAGCLVGRLKRDHRAFMAMVKLDPRYRVNNGYRFITSIVPAALVA